jgi:hypothetical protein
MGRFGAGWPSAGSGGRDSNKQECTGRLTCRYHFAGSITKGDPPALSFCPPFPGRNTGPATKRPPELGDILNADPFAYYACGLLNKGHIRLLEAAHPGQMAIMVYKEVGGELLQQLLMDNPNTNILCSKFNAIVQPPRLSHDPHNFTDIFCTMEEGGPHVTIVQGLANGYGAELERTYLPWYNPANIKLPNKIAELSARYSEDALETRLPH